MSSAQRERLLHLLADQALFGLDMVEETELESLLIDAPEIDAECMERVAAACELAHLSETAWPLPGPLAEKIRGAALSWLRQSGRN